MNTPWQPSKKVSDIYINEKGEIAEHGAAWACAGFGRPGHDYITCPLCRTNFDRYLEARK
jgi:hypothetical protein